MEIINNNNNKVKIKKYFLIKLNKLIKIFEISTTRAKYLYFFYLIIAILNSLFEIAVIFSILPFLEYFISGNSDLLNKISSYLSYFSFLEDVENIKFLSIFVILIFFFKLLFNILHIALYEFIISTEQSFIFKKLLKNYLSKDYVYFKNMPSSILVKNLSKEIPTYCNGILSNILITVSEIIFASLLFILLFVYNFQVTIFALTVFISLSLIYLFITKKYIKRFGQKRLDSDSNVYNSVLNIFENIKKIKIFNKGNFFSDNSVTSYNQSVSSIKKFNIISKLPRIIFEFFLLLVLVSTLIFYLDKKDVIYIIALFAAASIRIIPSISRLSSAIQNFKFSTPSLNIVYSGVIEQKNSTKNYRLDKKIDFKDIIEIKSIYFHYIKEKKIFENFNYNIKKNKFIGILGKTGSGKSTLIELLTGLIFPQKGSIKIDNIILNEENVLEWQKKIGYMPQTITILNDTIKSNIAFGEKVEKINEKLVFDCLEKVQLKNFCLDKPQGLNTIINEKGLNISGGEKQRIALARTLYFNPDIIVLDESTSSLDSFTEEKILQDIKKLKNKTIIFVTHKEKNLIYCDEIINLNK